MAKVCGKCGKIPSVGHRVSHSNIKTLRRYEPNLIRKRLPGGEDGALIYMKVCTACLRTMVKPPHRRKRRVPAAPVAAAA